MKALSPFLPDVSTLTELFASAGIGAIIAPPRPVDPSSTGPRGASAAAPPSSAGSAEALPRIRFPAHAPSIEVPAKGPARAGIAEPAPRGQASAPPPAAAPTLTPAARPLTSAPPAASDSLSDEVALRQIFGSNERAALPLQRRLEGFVEWLGGAVAARAAFVADADGLVLANRNAPESYVVATASLSHAEDTVLKSYIPRPLEGTTTMDLDENHFLQVIRVDTVVGRLVVGLIVAGPLSRSACAMVRRLLRLGVEEERVS
jgi:hypothetical protein